MLLKNCRLIRDKKESIYDILIEGEKFVRIEKNIEDIPNKNCEIVDIGGRWVLPGVVDVHCHMREPGLSHKEDFECGSRACAKGGVTTFIDMPNTIPNVITKEILEEKRKKLDKRSYVDYGFHFGGSREDNSCEIEKVKDEVVSTKIFMNVSTGNMLVEDEEILENIFKNSKIVSVHSEGTMVEKAIEIASKYDTFLYLCHISTKEEVQMIRKAKKRGVKVAGEVTPHHLFLNAEDREKSEENSYLLRMKPELKTKEDNLALWEALEDGTIDTIGTDHAPHLVREKKEKITFGIPGVENSLEMMLKGVDDGKISMARLIEIMSKNPAKIFKIKNKGKIEVGYDADLVVIDRDDKTIIGEDEVVSKCGWTPYKSFKRGGRVLTTIVRGKIVYDKDRFYEKNGREIKYYE